MKIRMFLVPVLLLCASLRAQEFNSGSITLSIDKTEIDVPVSSISIRKSEKTIVSIKGRSEEGDRLTNVYIEFGIDTLKEQVLADRDVSMKIDMSTGRFYGFAFSFKGGYAEYLSIGEQFKYDNVDSIFRIDSVDYENGSMIIRGSFGGSYSVSHGKAKQVSQTVIRNGKFKIII